MRERSRSPFSTEDEERSQRFDKQSWDNRRHGSARSRSPNNSSDRASVYVSNVPYECKWQDLKDVFRTEVGCVKHVDVMHGEGGTPRGTAIVTFETRELAEKALDTMNGHTLHGRKLVVKSQPTNRTSDKSRAMRRDRDARPIRTIDRTRQSLDRPVNSPASFGETYGLSTTFLQDLNISGPLVNKVFISNLDFKATDNDLEEVCQIAGKVVNVELSKDQEGRSRGFAVVEFAHPVQAVQAISMLNNQYYMDRKLNVRMDRIADKKPEVTNTKLPKGLKGIGMGLGANGQPMTDLAEIEGAVGLHGTGSSIQNRLGGISAGMSSSSMLPMSARLDMSSSTPAPIAPSLNMMNMAGQSSSFPLSDSFNSMSSMNSMGSMNMNPMNSMPSMGIRTNSRFDQPNPMASMNMASNMMPVNTASMNNTSLPYNPTVMGMSASNMASNRMGYSGGVGRDDQRSRTTIRIGNLPSDYTWQSLRELCRDYGDIKFAEMRPNGIGLVRYSNEAEAIRAADMLDRQRFDGKFLDACVA